MKALLPMIEKPRTEQPEASRFAEALELHAETEEQVLYPAALLVGECIRARPGA